MGGGWVVLLAFPKKSLFSMNYPHLGLCSGFLSVDVKKTLTKNNLRKERVYLGYTSTLQSNFEVNL